ncbi:MAG: sigma 54-interacting transcriptional regulator [Gammaproteobacteria bacterium]
MPNLDRYAWLFHDLPIIASLADAEGRFADVSDAWIKRLGHGRDELLGKSPLTIATQETARRIREEYMPTFRRTGRLDHVAVEFIAKSGETVSLLATTIAADDDEDADGMTRRSLTVYNERTDDERLHGRYRDRYRVTPAMLHTIDGHGRISAVSDHWLDKMGYRREEVIGRSIIDFVTEASREEMPEQRLKTIMETGGSNNVPRQMVLKSGEVIDVIMSSDAHNDPITGEPTLLVASKDVTDRNRAEAKLRDAYAEIERLNDELEQERDYLREEVSVAMNFGRIIGDSPALRRMIARIEAVADTPASVLIVGETGSGKELVSHAIHARSARADGPLVKVNCASIPDELFESEFFGHVRGAFTGAHQDRIGRFQLADGGTLFLDEVGEIPLPLQGKLLRVLQEKEFERVGDDTSRSVDVRVIAATNKDLEKAVEAGEFREDLFYRLSVFPVEVPPLRERGDDVIMIAVEVLDQVCRDFGRAPLTFTQKQVDALRRYDWPGNVRELKNVIERAVILSDDQHLRLDLSLPEAGLASPAAEAREAPEPEAPSPSQAFLTEAEMRERTRANLVAALEAAEWRVAGARGAARLLGIKPSTLTDRMRSLGIERPR